MSDSSMWILKNQQISLGATYFRLALYIGPFADWIESGRRVIKRDRTQRSLSYSPNVMLKIHWWILPSVIDVLSLCSRTRASELWFLSRVSTLTRDIDIAIMSVCLSVCPSRSDILSKRLNYVVVLWVSNIFLRNSNRGAKYMRYKKFAIFDQ